MNLAPNFPEDTTMQQLLQLLHEEIGLPKHKTIHLQTSINFDLGCDGSEASSLLQPAGLRCVSQAPNQRARRQATADHRNALPGHQDP
jgi:hypothetical protein